MLRISMLRAWGLDRTFLWTSSAGGALAYLGHTSGRKSLRTPGSTTIALGGWAPIECRQDRAADGLAD